jgi:hypothetical protein
MIQKTVWLMDLGKDVELKISVLRAIYFTEVA